MLNGLNLIGLKRAGVDRKEIAALRAAFQTLAQGHGTFQERASRLEEETTSEYVDLLTSLFWVLVIIIHTKIFNIR